jgi:hypothetical protein
VYYSRRRHLSSDLGLYGRYELEQFYPTAFFWTYIKNVAHARLTVSRARMEGGRTWERLLRV